MGMVKIIHRVLSLVTKLGFKEIVFGLLLVIAFLGIGGSYYFYNKYQEIIANPNIEAKKETDALVSVISDMIELPPNEMPTVATILDKEKLANQPFFINGENGDKLLAYSVAKIAILYRPSTGKIINVAPITETEPNVSSQAVEKGHTGHLHRIVYLNGTETAGKGYLAEKAVQEKYPNTYKTIAVENAVKKDYEGVLVIDLVGDHGEEVQDLATLFNGVVSTLPSEEVAPDADILVISGE